MLFIERTIYYKDIYFSYYKQYNIQTMLYIKMNLLYNTHDINISILINILYYNIYFIFFLKKTSYKVILYQLTEKLRYDIFF